MFCPTCGTNNAESAGFCVTCGTRLNPTTNATGDSFKTPPPPPNPSPSGGTNAKPKNWLVESILVTLFCCLPLGIVGIVHASKVDSKYASGDYAGAQQSSAEASKWTKIGFFVGIGLSVLYFIWLMAMGGLAMMNGGGY